MSEPKTQLKLLSVSELAELLGISKPFVYSLRNDPSFPKPAKIGRLNRWLLKDIETYLETSKGA
jgi:excisionase family DNA binding protein